MFVLGFEATWWKWCHITRNLTPYPWSVFPLSFHLLQKYRKQCERAKLNMKMPQLWRRPQSVLKIFLIFLLGLNVIFKQKTKKGSSCWRRHFFLWFYVDLKKKKDPSFDFCKFSLRFVRHTRVRRHVPQLSTVLAGNKNAGFWRGRKNTGICKNSVWKCWKKFRTFLHL